MRISIWQQWASNHSGGFTLVGVFETPEIAQKAKNELWRMLQAIRNERLKIPTPVPLWGTRKRWWKFNPIERQIAKHFDIEWPHHIEWVDDGESFGGDTVTQSGPIVFIDAYSWASQGPQPFDTIMAKLGAKVSAEVYGCEDREDVYLLLNIECEAPTAEQAETLKLAFRDILDSGTSPLNGLVDAYAHEILPPDTVHNQIVRQGTKLSFTNLRLGEIDYLPRFIKWLENEGCTNISYDFVEITPEQEE